MPTTRPTVEDDMEEDFDAEEENKLINEVKDASLVSERVR
jgi:hypothetical protein